MTTLARTPIDHDDAQEIIEHVNEGHVPELLLCARAFTPISAPAHARMTDVFTDGFQLDVTDADGATSHFVPYSVPESPHVAIRATVDAALKKLGIKPEARVAHWRVLDNRVLTQHFRRLVLDLQGDTREDWHPGYACRFDVPGQEHGRPYTLRRLSGTKTEVDVYCHDNTLGSQWAEGIQAGDTVTARGGRNEGLPDFSKGAALLLGDETALPTVAALLEGWAEEHPVRVLLEVGDVADQRYLDDVHLPRGVHVSWLPRTAESGGSIREVLDTLGTPPVAVWGALEVSSAKSLRKQLQADYPGTDVRVTGYWRVNEKN